MNEQDRAELEQLKRRQEALQMQLAGLTADIHQLSDRLKAGVQPALAMPSLEAPPLPIPPLKIQDEPARVMLARPVAHQANAVPPPLPPVLPDIAQTGPTTAAADPPLAATPSPRQPAAEKRDTLEMKVGTYWLVRVGIVMLLTGLVFLGTYAYNNIVERLGAAGKVALLYAAGAALLGFGGWLQRKREKEALRNYGQVLFAGGLAAVFFTTYAAHYVSVLRVIASPVVDALLLLAWAGLTVWIADRRKSEVLALFAVGLSYYASAITDVGFFTLYSNLVLTAAAVFFLIRNRWATLSFISVFATYGGFAFWRFHHGDWGWDGRSGELMRANIFLGGYWLFFSTAVFFSRDAKLVNANRSLFASLNNGAFFGLVLLSMMHAARGHFWQFSLGFGATLLVAALLARRFLGDEPAIKNTFLVQGLTLITVGFIAHFTGLKLALILAAESLMLTVLGQQQKNPFVRAGGYLCAALSAGWVLLKMTSNQADVALGAAVGAAFLFNAWWEHRNETNRAFSLMRPSTGYFVALAVGVCGVVLWQAVPEPWRAVALMIGAVTLTACFYGLRIPELPICSQALTLVAQGYWFFQFGLKQESLAWIVCASLVAGAVALSHWWQRQQSIPVAGEWRNVPSLIFALPLVAWAAWRTTPTYADLALAAIVVVSFLLSAAWEKDRDSARPASVLDPFCGCLVALAVVVCGVVAWHAVPEPWIAVAWMIESVGLTALFYALRRIELPLFAQALALAAQGFWFFEFALRRERPYWLVPATLIAGTLVLSHWWQRQKQLVVRADVRNVLQIVHGLAFVGVVFFWFQPKFAPAAWLAFLSVLALGVTIYGVITRAWALAACAQIFLLVSSLEMLHQFAESKPSWEFALVPLATWLVLGTAATVWLSRHDTVENVRRPLLQVSLFYRGVAFVMSLWWIYAYVPRSNQFWLLCALGLALVAVAGGLKNREALLFSGGYLGVAFAAWFTRFFGADDVVSWPNGLAMLAVLGAQQCMRRLPRRYEVPRQMDSIVVLITGLALWTFVSRWVVITSGAHFLLTVSWAVLAAGLFTAGFVWRERMHRWLGLFVLACAVGRVFVSDVWKLETIYRILSFMALGIVLLALGFIYTKYQDKIRQWL